MYNNKKKIDISIVIPAYNEAKRIRNTLKKVYDYFKKKGLDFEIIVVDDGSKDNTINIVKNFSINQPEVKLKCHLQNQGKGAAVRTGILASEGNIVVFTDADLSTPIEEFEKLKDAIEEGYDIAVASRYITGAEIKVKQPIIRRFIGIFGRWIIKILIFKNINDTLCGFKMFRKDCGKMLFKDQKIKGFAFDVEILYKAVKKGYKIKEVPVEWINSLGSKVSVLKDPIRFFIALVKIRIGF